MVRNVTAQFSFDSDRYLGVGVRVDPIHSPHPIAKVRSHFFQKLKESFLKTLFNKLIFKHFRVFRDIDFGSYLRDLIII